MRPEGTLVVTVMGESIERVRVEAFDQPSSSDSMRKRTEMEIVLIREKEETKEFRFPNGMNNISEEAYFNYSQTKFFLEFQQMQWLARQLEKWR